jgi:hypothetical protein
VTANNHGPCVPIDVIVECVRGIPDQHGSSEVIDQP